jgi:peptide/nickel transport system permease protein
MYVGEMTARQSTVDSLDNPLLRRGFAQRHRVLVRLISRLLGVLGVLFSVATLTFLAAHLMPGNPAVTILGGAGSHPTHAEVVAIDHLYGFNRSLIAQYLTFIGHLLTGNLGTSYVLKEKVTTIVSQQMGATFLLTVSALVLSWLLALLGTLATTRRNRFLSAVGSGFEIFVAGLPQYWLGIILLVVFAFRLRWFPVEGGTGIQGLVLPALTLALPLAGFIGQVTRDEFSAVLEQPFVVSARTRGMSDTGVRTRHVLRHSILPGITLSGWALGSLFSTAVIVEAVFARQGLGQVLVNAVSQQDIPVVIGVTLLVALVYVAANLLVDLVFLIADPRMRQA